MRAMSQENVDFIKGLMTAGVYRGHDGVREVLGAVARPMAGADKQTMLVDPFDLRITHVCDHLRQRRNVTTE